MNLLKFRVLGIIGLILGTVTVSTAQIILQNSYGFGKIPTAPDYENSDNWASLPTKKDPADNIPLKSHGLKDEQATAKADVFFVHPTIYTYRPVEGTFEWNADLNDAELNRRVDESTILNQASVFNGSCRVYAPRYRQAHYYSFVTKNREDRQKALDLAYLDVKAAFQYYLSHYNQGRPIVIAGHSQGTYHAKRLLKEFFDGKPLQQSLVFAYLVGDITEIPTQPNEFQQIKPAQAPDEVGGFAAWRTYQKDFFPEKYETDGFQTSVCTNPLTWLLNEEYASKKLNKGGVGLKYTFHPHLADAQVHQGLLWINKPYITGRAFLKTKVWHTADINLFWQNIRENVALRVESFLKKQ